MTLEELTEIVESHGQSIAVLEVMDRGHTEGLERFLDMLDTMRQTINDLSRSIEHQAGSIQALSSRLDTVSETVDRLTDSLEGRGQSD